jgi:hypothetical protein
MGTAFDDMDSDLEFGTPTPARPMAEIAQPRYATARDSGVYAQPCKKCNGSGVFKAYTGRILGNCFVCNGEGKQTFKTSPEARAKARESAAARAETKARESLEAFAREFPDMHAWIIAKAPGFEFAASMLEAVKRWGTLTDGQRGAVERCMERDAARDAERAAKAAAAAARPVERMDALFEVMQKHSKFYAGDITLSRAREHSTVWIKHAQAEKAVGKLEHGVLTMWTRPGVDMDSIRETLGEFDGAPLAAAVRYGKLTGRCCSCGRELTDPASIEAGIGPICAGKF